MCWGVPTRPGKSCIIYQMTQPPRYGHESQVYTITVAQITGGDSKSLEVNPGYRLIVMYPFHAIGTTGFPTRPRKPKKKLRTPWIWCEIWGEMDRPRTVTFYHKTWETSGFFSPIMEKWEYRSKQSEVEKAWSELNLNLSFGSVFRRLVRLLEEIMNEKENKTLIFTETKKKADDVARRLKRDG